MQQFVSSLEIGQARLTPGAGNHKDDIKKK